MPTADPEGIEVRDSTCRDLAAIEQLYHAAFPEEDLLPVVTELLSGQADVLSLIAMDDGLLVGNVIFTFCTVPEHNVRAALLAPLAVSPDNHKQGIGGHLVHNGLACLRDDGVACAFVLGDPTYYGRFGFQPEHLVAPPYPMPGSWQDAWQGLSLSSQPTQHIGSLCLPEMWLKRKLWSA
tara:strand:+ start:189 stop:728 length:540 start_codon:yes stop_codon:yes gene_type:complete